MVNSRIQHIKKRFKVFEYFEKMRLGIFKNHNMLVEGVTKEVEQSADKA